MGIFGTDFYGHVDRIPGKCVIATQFSHWWFFPCVPMGSWILRGHADVPAERAGWHLRSILTAWLRVGTLLGAWLCAFLGAAFLNAFTVLSEVPDWKFAWTIPVSLAAALGLYIVRRWSLCETATLERALALGARAGIPEQEVREALAQPYPARPPANPWIRRGLALVAVTSLMAGLAAKAGKVNMGRIYATVTVAEAEQNVSEQWDATISLEGELDLAGTIHGTGLSEPEATPHPPDKPVVLDAALLADTARLASFAGAPVVVEGAAEGKPLRFEYESDLDFGVFAGKNVLLLAPLAGTSGRLWIASRWLPAAKESDEGQAFFARKRFEGRLALLKNLSSNLALAPDLDKIQEAAAPAGQPVPAADALVIQTGDLDEEHRPTGSIAHTNALVPMKGGSLPVFVEVPFSLAATLTSPVKGHLDLVTYVTPSRFPGVPAGTEKVLVLETASALRFEEQRQIRTGTSLAVGGASALVWLLFPLLP